MEQQKITLEEVKAACRKAYDEGRLLAQNQYKYHGEFFYRRNDCACAIGCALREDVAAAIPDVTDTIGTFQLGSSATSREEWPFTWDEAEEDELANIQSIHDNWVRSQEGKRELSPLAFRLSFLEAIDHPAANSVRQEFLMAPPWSEEDMRNAAKNT